MPSFLFEHMVDTVFLFFVLCKHMAFVCSCLSCALVLTPTLVTLLFVNLPHLPSFKSLSVTFLFCAHSVSNTPFFAGLPLSCQSPHVRTLCFFTLWSLWLLCLRFCKIHLQLNLDKMRRFFFLNCHQHFFFHFHKTFRALKILYWMII